MTIFWVPHLNANVLFYMFFKNLIVYAFLTLQIPLMSRDFKF
jgi:hypothetical protein